MSEKGDSAIGLLSDCKYELSLLEQSNSHVILKTF